MSILKRRLVLFCDTRIDLKYRKIFDGIPDLDIREGTFFRNLIDCLKQKGAIYHLRYARANFFLMVLKYLLLFACLKMNNGSIIWSCHNIEEHNISNRAANYILLMLRSAIAKKIIVFDEQVKKHLPKRAQKKTHVACFGSMYAPNFAANDEFQTSYRDWLAKNRINTPNIISVSAAKRSTYTGFLNLDKSIFAMIIAPGVVFDCASWADQDNIMIYNHNHVSREVGQILTNGQKLIGYLGHCNMSVPTSLYMYASYMIPIIVSDNEPLRAIVAKYRCGEVLDEVSDISEAYRKIVRNYKQYQKGLHKFLSDHTWEKSTRVHTRILNSLVETNNE